ncbi:MAG: sodium ion-translocating decarboxylase subunit beta [Oscillospiraceae bacterium]
MSMIQILTTITWQQIVMWLIGSLLIYLAIKKGMEPTLLLPMGFGAILVNLPLSGVVDRYYIGNVPATLAQYEAGLASYEPGVIDELFNMGIANELFPLLLFIGIGAMIDFGPLLSNPKMLLFGAAAQFGIFFTLGMATLLGFEIKDAASIAIIGAADGPTSIFVANFFQSNYMGAIMVAAYSYMALVPIIQPPVIRLITTKKERLIRMPYVASEVSQRVRILFPIVVTVIAGFVAPRSVALIGFLMFGNLIRECGVLGSLSQTAQDVLANLITLFLGITVASRMRAEMFVTKETLMILGLGLIAFVFDTAGGVFFAKFLNLFTKNKVNPMIGAAGISAFPMSARVIHKMGQQEDNQNFLLMHAVGANVSGQIASVIAGGMILSLIAK